MFLDSHQTVDTLDCIDLGGGIAVQKSSRTRRDLGKTIYTKAGDGCATFESGARGQR